MPSLCLASVLEKCFQKLSLEQSFSKIDLPLYIIKRKQTGAPSKLDRDEWCHPYVSPLFLEKKFSKNCHWSSLFRKLTSDHIFLEEAKRCSLRKYHLTYDCQKISTEASELERKQGMPPSVLPLFLEKNFSKNCHWSSLFRKLTSDHIFLEEAKRCSLRKYHLTYDCQKISIVKLLN